MEHLLDRLDCGCGLLSRDATLSEDQCWLNDSDSFEGFLMLFFIDSSALPRDVRDLPQGSPGKESQSNVEAVPERLQYLPEDLVLSSRVSCAI